MKNWVLETFLTWSDSLVLWSRSEPAMGKNRINHFLKSELCSWESLGGSLKIAFLFPQLHSRNDIMRTFRREIQYTEVLQRNKTNRVCKQRWRGKDAYIYVEIYYEKLAPVTMEADSSQSTICKLENQETSWCNVVQVWRPENQISWCYKSQPEC